MVKKQTNKTEKILFIFGSVFILVVIGLTVYAFMFLSANMFKALSGAGDGRAQTTEFDVEGFEKLGL